LLSNTKKLKAGLAATTAVAAVALCIPAGASANCGGGGITPAEIDMCTPTPKARLLANGMLIPPKGAPARVKDVIAAANRIRTKPYIYGGGHAKWWDRGYDCSGSVSYALHGGNFISSPLPSGPMEHWGSAGEGRWITVWANAGHAYAEIAGFRWDTSGDASGTGPRWHPDLRENVGYVARHPLGY
jgi:cell wall-associated NlpC family hydrolase